MYTKPQSNVIIITIAALLCCTPFTAAHAKATFSINYTDSNGEGFNDPTVVTSPIGNNAGTTLGTQRKIAFEYVIEILSIVLHSDVTIEIDAHFDPLGGSEFSATLAQAGPNTVHFDFSSAPESNVYYVQALANKLSGSDLDNSSDIDAQFNTDIDGSTVLGSDSWYYGLDANPPGTDTDFVSVALHEITHGLGFLSLGNTSTGALFSGRSDIYSFYLEHNGAAEPIYTDMTNTQRATANKATGELQWGGTKTENNANTYLTTGLNGSNPQIYAPDPNEAGSSVSHFSDSLGPNQLMEPFYSEVTHDIGIAGAVLADMGWGSFTNLSLTLTDSADPVAAGDIIYLVATITNIGTGSAQSSVFNYTIPSGLSFSSASPSQGNCTATSEAISCALGTIAAGGSSNVSFSLSSSVEGTVTHGASVYADIVDVSPANNLDTETTTIQAPGTVANNNAPTAISGSDQTVEVGVNVSLDGSSSSDSDGSITTYSWLQISGNSTISIINADTAKPTLTAPSSTDTLVFQLTVTDNVGATSSDTVTVIVTSNSGGSDINSQSSAEATSNSLTGGSSGGAISFIALLFLPLLIFKRLIL